MTMLVLIFGMFSTAFAGQSSAAGDPQDSSQLSKDEKATIEDELKNFDVEEYASNLEELSKVNRQIINDTLKNFNLDNAETFGHISENGEMIVILQTEKENTTVAITDNVVEVIEKVNTDDYKINSQNHHIEVTLSEGKTSSNSARTSTEVNSGEATTLAADGWIETSYKSGPWDFQFSDWVNINAERTLSSLSAGAVGSIVSGAIAASVGAGPIGGAAYSIGVGIAYAFASGDAYPTNVGKVYMAVYLNSPYPTADRKIYTNAYAVYQGDTVYLGTDNTYYARCIGCGGA